MANYITTLKAEKAALARQVATMQSELRAFLAHLDLPKFQGTDNQWISTNDVRARLHAIEASGISALEAEEI